MGVQIPSEPITRKEQYLAKIAGQAVEIPAEPITREEAYLAAIAKGGGGGGGTGDYNDLINQPQIGGNTLVGNKSASDLGLASEEDLAGKQNALTAGLYIEFDDNEIPVKRDITQIAQEIAYNFTIPGDYTLRVKKYMQGDLVDTTDYQFNNVVDPINLDSIMEVSKKTGGGFYWVVKNLIASTTQAADYSVELYALQTSTNYTQNFIATIDADKKLIIQSELDAAINAIKDGQSIDSFADVEAALGEKADTDIVASDFSAAVSYTAGDYCIYEGKFYKFKNNHSGAWAAADVDEIKIAGELSALKSGLTVKSATISNEHFTTVRVSEVGGVKCLYIATTGSDTALDTTADYVEYFTLPVGFRPATLYYNRFVSKKSAATTDTDWVIKIDTNGKVSLFNYSGEEHPGFSNTFVFI